MKIARHAGVSAEDFNATMRNRELLEAIVAVRQQGVDKWKINSTPTFVINDDEVIPGNISYEEFADRIGAWCLDWCIGIRNLTYQGPDR